MSSQSSCHVKPAKEDNLHYMSGAKLNQQISGGGCIIEGASPLRGKKLEVRLKRPISNNNFFIKVAHTLKNK